MLPDMYNIHTGSPLSSAGLARPIDAAISLFHAKKRYGI
jgi:hypothetical protein